MCRAIAPAVQAALECSRLTVSLKLASPHDRAGDSEELDARVAAGARQRVGVDGERGTVVRDRQIDRGAVVPRRRLQRAAEGGMKRLVAARIVTGAVHPREHAALEVKERVARLAGVGELEPLGVADGDVLGSLPAPRLSRDGLGKSLPQVRGAVAHAPVLDADERAADTQRAEHGAVAGFVDAAEKEGHRETVPGGQRS